MFISNFLENNVQVGFRANDSAILDVPNFKEKCKTYVSYPSLSLHDLLREALKHFCKLSGLPQRS